MCTLQMQVRCGDRFFEILPENVVSSELMVEDVVGHGLLDLFEKVEVEDVTICFHADSRTGKYCSICIHADCFCQPSVLLTYTEENLKQALENSVLPPLKELFGSVEIDSIMFSTSPGDYEHDPVLSQQP
jgi:hypothetical protein